MTNHWLQKMKMGINGKVVMAMFLVVLSIMLIIAFYSYSMTKKILIDQVERKISARNENIRTTVSTTFMQKGEIVRQLSFIPVIGSFMSANETKENAPFNKDYDWIKKVLMDAKKKNENIQLIWLAHEKNSYYIADQDYMRDELYSIQERLWYKKASKSEGVSFSPPYIDYATKKLTISITHPVSIDNGRLGYLGIDIHLDNLGELLKPFEIDGQKLILVSNQGDVLYDSENMWSTLQDATLEDKKVLKLKKDKNTYYASV